MLFESKVLSDDEIYFLTNTVAIGTSFSPDIGPTLTINTITAGTPTTNIVETTAAHGLTSGDQIMLTGTTTTPVVNGLYTVTKLTSTTFRINTTITVGDLVSPAGVAIQATNAESSSNEEAVNRIYYSKQDQPEAVPIVNYFDVGAGEKEILRIMPLSDSLFVFKEDGVYRVSGESPPFSQQLFDSSFDVIAPDSVAVCNNEVYAWTTQGISKLTEGGSTPAISRPIDTSILKLNDSRYPDFSTSTFGLGYDSENSYSRTWAGTPFSFSTNALHSQNSLDSSYAITFPNITFVANNIKPFKRTGGTERFYEKFAFSYNTTLENKINFKAKEVGQPDFLSKFRSGMKHSFSITLPDFSLLKYLKFVPSVNYGMNWYFQKSEKVYNSQKNIVEDKYSDLFKHF